MPVSIVHHHVTTLPNDPTKDISADAWNAAHDITGLGSMALVDDAPSDGNTYGRNNGAWALGPTGPQGPKGDPGTDGVGVPAGGTTNQVLAKNSNADYDTKWADAGGSSAGVVPVGGIIMWSGTIATIPASWALCDGTANAPGPDLRDQFVVGARQDSGGIAKTNLTGALAQTGGTTAHSHSAHANLTHTGLTIGDHTGLTHGLTIANHPDLTHSISNLALASFTGAQASMIASFASQSAAVASGVATIPTGTNNTVGIPSGVHSIPSGTTGSVPSGVASIASGVTGSVASSVLSIPSGTTASAPNLTGTQASATVSNIGSLTLSISSQGTARTVATYGGAPAVPSGTHTHAAFSATLPSVTGSVPSGVATLTSHTGSVPSGVLTLPSITGSVPSQSAGLPSLTGSVPSQSVALASATGSTPSGSHTHAGSTLTPTGYNSHLGTDYGVHTFTAPAAHGTAGTVTHSYNEPSDHVISAHDTVANVIPFFALAFIQRVA